MVNTNRLDEGWARVVRENSAYYLIGYYSSNSRADGKTRRNEVKLSRARLRPVYRPFYLAPVAEGVINK